MSSPNRILACAVFLAVSPGAATAAANGGAHLTNISSRAFVGAGFQVLVTGFVVSGSTSETVLIRAVGPTLSQYAVSGPLANPELDLYDSTGGKIAANIGWGSPSAIGSSTVQAGIQPATTAVFNQVYAFVLPTGSADCAMVATLPPGSYTAQVSGVGGTTGTALVEVYDVP